MPSEPAPVKVLTVMATSNCRLRSSRTRGVTVMVVPASAKPAKLVVATVCDALTLVKGTSSTLVNWPVALSLTRMRGTDVTRARRCAMSARVTTSAVSGSTSVPLNAMPGTMDSAPLTGSTVLSPYEENAIMRFKPERPEISTPKEKSWLVSMMTNFASTMT